MLPLLQLASTLDDQMIHILKPSLLMGCDGGRCVMLVRLQLAVGVFFLALDGLHDTKAGEIHKFHSIHNTSTVDHVLHTQHHTHYPDVTRY